MTKEFFEAEEIVIIDLAYFHRFISCDHDEEGSTLQPFDPSASITVTRHDHEIKHWRFDWPVDVRLAGTHAPLDFVLERISCHLVVWAFCPLRKIFFYGCKVGERENVRVDRRRRERRRKQ